jgi:xanthine dehydrogenase large subunit
VTVVSDELRGVDVQDGPDAHEPDQPEPDAPPIAPETERLADSGSPR